MYLCAKIQKQSKMKSILKMVAAVLAVGLATASCVKEDNAVIDPIVEPEQQQLSVDEWLARIPGVSDIRKAEKSLYDKTKAVVYTFNFTQPRVRLLDGRGHSRPHESERQENHSAPWRA